MTSCLNLLELTCSETRTRFLVPVLVPTHLHGNQLAALEANRHTETERRHSRKMRLVIHVKKNTEELDLQQRSFLTDGGETSPLRRRLNPSHESMGQKFHRLCCWTDDAPLSNHFTQQQPALPLLAGKQEVIAECD